MRKRTLITLVAAIVTIGGGLWVSQQQSDDECDETEVGCGDIPVVLQPGEAAPTLHTIWPGMFASCGIGCHNPGASDFTEMGPDFSTPDSFYAAVVGKTIKHDYPQWRDMLTSSCSDVPLIASDSAANSLLLATINEKAHEQMKQTNNCTSSFNLHSAVRSVVSVISDEQLQILQHWVEGGIQQ